MLWIVRCKEKNNIIRGKKLQCLPELPNSICFSEKKLVIYMYNYNSYFMFFIVISSYKTVEKSGVGSSVRLIKLIFATKLIYYFYWQKWCLK